MKKFIIPVLAAATFLAGGQLFAQQKKNFINASFNVSNESTSTPRMATSMTTLTLISVSLRRMGIISGNAGPLA